MRTRLRRVSFGIRAAGRIPGLTPDHHWSTVTNCTHASLSSAASPPAGRGVQGVDGGGQVSTFTSRMPSLIAGAGLVAVVGGHQEDRRAGVAAALILCVIPPMGPTAPSGGDGSGARHELAVVPGSPVVSLSTTAGLNISPADGPPMLARLKSTLNGAHGALSTATPR